MGRAVAVVALLLSAAPVALAQPAPGPGLAGALGGGTATVSSLFAPGRTDVLVAAHRANSGRWLARVLDWPLGRTRGPAARAENSLAAIDAAIAAGADVVEIDVRASRDGVLVLMHDDTIDRTTDAKGRVDQLTWAELQRARLLPQGRIPTLDEALRHARGRCVLDLDVKTDRIDLVVAAVAAAGAHDGALLFDGSVDALRRAKRLDPRVEVMPRARDVAGALALLADPELRPRVVHVDGPDDLTPAVVAAARAAGARLWVNALGPKDVLGVRAYWERLARRGAGVIQTDRPECVDRATR